METSILQRIKKKAGGFIEPKLLKTGRVLEVRVWDTKTMIEIDLHLPFADMQHWNDVPYIKIRVDDLCYRDYTPFGWDAETCTCSVLIDTTHEGPGINWAKQLRTGDTIRYLKIEGTRQAPHATNLVVGLGDTSSLGHLLALQQLTMPNSRFDGAVLLDNPGTGQLFRDYFRSPISTLTNHNGLTNWLIKQDYCTAHTCFYLTGNHHLVANLRRLLKSLGHHNIRIKGFWS